MASTGAAATKRKSSLSFMVMNQRLKTNLDWTLSQGWIYIKMIPSEYEIISIQIQGEIYSHPEKLVELAQRYRSQTNTPTNHIYA